MTKVVTLTVNPALDKSTSIKSINPGPKLRCAAPNYEPGGGGINVSRAIHRLGGYSLAVHTTGGAIGDMFCDILAQEGIKHRSIRVREITRVSFTVLEESSNQQYRFVMPGPFLSESEWQHCLDILFGLDPPPEYIVASGSLPPGVPVDFYGRLAKRTREAGVRLIVDASGEALVAAAEEGVYLLKPNMRELRQLSGESFDGESQQKRVVQQLVAQGKAKIIVVSMGAAGAIFAAEGVFERIRTPTVEIKSKIGAGDSMVAGIVLALARGKSIPIAVRFGIAAGASAVATPGTELCRRSHTDELFQQMIEELDRSNGTEN